MVSKTRQGRPAGAADERQVSQIEEAERPYERAGAEAGDDDSALGQIEDWIIVADRRMERLDAKIDRLGAAVDQLNLQLGELLNDMPTRKGINLYLVGGLVGGLAVGLAIMGITIGGFVGGLSSLRPEGGQAAAPAYPAPAPAPIIIQMPSGSLPGTGAVVAPAQPALPTAPGSAGPAK